MKLYRATTSRIVAFTPADGAIKIGGIGRGRIHTIVPVVGDAVDDAEYEAVKTESGVVLRVVDDARDLRSLVVVHTGGGYSKGRNYDWHDATGMTVIASGHCAEGAAGRAGGSEVYLAIAEPNAQFALVGKYGDRHWFRYDGRQWQHETHDARLARLAIEEVSDGGGELL